MTLPPEAAAVLRAEITRAGGREVCFLAEVDGDRRIVNPRAVARGNSQAVLAVARDAPDGSILIHNHPSGVLEPSDADLVVAARVWDEGLGTALVDNGATRMYVVVEPPEPRVRVPLDVPELEAALGPRGPLSKIFPGYEDREGQRAMLGAVARAYNEEAVQLVEAGTGTGKTLAYLLPAARWAQANGERTVVSTATINLQEQLVGKDLPLLSRILDEPVKWALVKGRANYVSIRRALLAHRSQETLFEDDREQELRGILEWMETTEDGSLSDLPFSPSEEVWEEVKSDSDICLRARCPHFQRCFYQQSRREAASAQILVVNHHLLFSDLAVRMATNNYRSGAVLPSYRRLVLDEAHNVEEAATSHLGAEITRRGLYRTLSRLDRRGKGVLSAVQDVLAGRGQEGEAPRLLRRLEERIRPALEELRARAGLLVETLEPLAADAPGPVRLGPSGGVEPAADLRTRDLLEGTLDGLNLLERELRRLREEIQAQAELLDALEDRLLDLQSAERRLAAAAQSLRTVLDPGPDRGEWVRWLEVRGRGPRRNLALGAAPLEPGSLLRDGLFEPMDTTILTSATLTTRESFRFLRSRLGLGDPGGPGAGGAGEWDLVEDWLREEEADGSDLEVRELTIPSPFRYAEQARLVVPTDLGAAGAEAFHRGTAAFVRDLARRTDGGIFVLFTAFQALQAVARELREGPDRGRWPLLVHGEGPRSALLEAFVASGRAILLGTQSFWEGVDVPGDPLRGLVIQKLPFPVPTEPVVEARVEALEARGVNAFWEYTLPVAALRLKQGFGRLIRSQADRGVVAILDSRLLTQRYGRYFRESLPELPLIRGPVAEVWRGVDDFLGIRRPGAG